MQPLNKSKPSFGRVRGRRKEHEGENFTWAVSYSDLLMVLMSFFIVFFQLEPGTSDPNQVQSVISAIKNEFSKNAAVSMQSTGRETGVDGGVATSTPISSPASGFTASVWQTSTRIPSSTGTVSFQQITSALANQNIAFKSNPKENFLLVELESDLYGKGQVVLSPQAKVELERVFKVLEPHLATLSISVVGHSDSIAVTQTKDRPDYLNSNLAFSSLRALIGTQYLIQLGVSPDQIKTEATDQFQRNSRSLSIKVYGRGKS